MSNERIKQLLAELQAEIHQSDMDDETSELIQSLDKEIREYLDTDNAASQGQGILEKTKSLETTFAARHPSAELFLREIIDALGKMGI